jgi:hypothetical protein
LMYGVSAGVALGARARGAALSAARATVDSGGDAATGVAAMAESRLTAWR